MGPTSLLCNDVMFPKNVEEKGLENHTDLAENGVGWSLVALPRLKLFKITPFDTAYTPRFNVPLTLFTPARCDRCT
jgi:hypothetical protein